MRQRLLSFCIEKFSFLGRRRVTDRNPGKDEKTRSRSSDSADVERSSLNTGSDAVPTTASTSLHRSRSVVFFRAPALLLALIPLGLLGVARNLDPDSRGLGTHQQLGLPPCSMRVMFGIRCPGCGMTTSWAHFTRGHWGRSIQANLAGFLLACLSLLVAPAAISAAWTGKTPSHRFLQIVTAAAVGIAVVSLLEWAYRLAG